MTTELNAAANADDARDHPPLRVPDCAPADSVGQRRGSEVSSIELTRPGVVPDEQNTSRAVVNGPAAEDPQRRESQPDQETITEVAPETGPAEYKPDQETITEVAPETGPAEYKPDHETITEVAPETGPAEYKPDHETITEVAPETGPAEYKPDQETITEVAPDSPEDG